MPETDCTDIMEHAGLSDNEIDNVLGHYSVKTALPHYQDRSEIAIAKDYQDSIGRALKFCKTVENMGFDIHQSHEITNHQYHSIIYSKL